MRTTINATIGITITFQPAGFSFTADAGSTILQAAERAAIELPSSCRNGTCRSCICRLTGGGDTAGRVRYLLEWPGLSFDEKRDGYILPCVAVALEDLSIEQRLARRTASPD
jgi:ferredoxin